MNPTAIIVTGIITILVVILLGIATILDFIKAKDFKNEEDK